MLLNADVLNESMMYYFDFGTFSEIGAKGIFSGRRGGVLQPADSAENTMPPLFRISYRGTSGSHKESISTNPCPPAEKTENDDND